MRLKSFILYYNDLVIVHKEKNNFNNIMKVHNILNIFEGFDEKDISYFSSL